MVHNRHMGCPRCESKHIEQTKRIAAVGWALILAGAVVAFMVSRLGLLLSIVGLVCFERQGKCKGCGWTWRV